MARFQNLQVHPEKCAIRVQFADPDGTASAGVMGWQLFDPGSGAFLSEGAWDATGPEFDLRVPMPREQGPYRVQIAPVGDRGDYISIEAQVGPDRLQVAPPRVLSAAGQRARDWARALPQAFTTPVQSLWRHRKLMRSMVRRDMLARYRGSFGGALWTFLTPLLLMATYAFVFGFVLESRFSGDPSGSGYVLYFLAGMLPWLAFSEAIGRAPTVILEYRGFVNKLVFPLETLPVNLVLAGLLTEIIGLCILLSALLILRHSLPGAVIWLPVLLFPQMLLAAGLAWFLAATGVFLRDLGQLIGFFLTLWFFLTPIGYEESKFSGLPGPAGTLLAANPILILVRGYRAILLENRAPWTVGANGAGGPAPLLWLWLAALLIAVLGFAWFRRLRRNFADVI